MCKQSSPPAEKTRLLLTMLKRRRAIVFAFLVYSQRCGGKNAFRFPEVIATSPLKKEGTFANEEAWQ